MKVCGSDFPGQRDRRIHRAVHQILGELREIERIEVDRLDLGHGEAPAASPADAELRPRLLVQDAPELGAEHAPDPLAPEAHPEEALRAAGAEVVRVAVVALPRELPLLRPAPAEPDQEAGVSAAVGEPAPADAAGFPFAGEEAEIVPVELVAAELDRHVQPRRRVHEAGVGLRLHGLAAGADAIRHPTAGAARIGVPDTGIAVRHAARGEAVRAVSGRLRRSRYPFRALDDGIARRHARRRARHRPPDHRAPRIAAGVVGIGEARPRRVLHDPRREAAFRHVGARIARHLRGARRIPRDRPRRCGSGPADFPSRPPWDRPCARPCPTSPTASGRRARTWRARPTAARPARRGR